MPIVSIAPGIQDLGTQPVGESCEMPKGVGVSRRHFKKTEECTGGNLLLTQLLFKHIHIHERAVEEAV